MEAAVEWAARLHHLWRSVTSITVRDELAALVLPPLQALPGVVAVWGLRHGPGLTVIEHRWSGHEPDPAQIEVSRALSADAGEQPRVIPLDGTPLAGVADQAVVSRFDVAGDPAGTFLVLTAPGADTGRITTCLAQVVEVTREAVRAIVVRRGEQLQQTRDALLAEASLQMDAVLDTAQTMRRVPRMAVPAIAEGCLVYVVEDGKPVMRSAVHVDMRRLSALLGDPAVADRLIALADRTIRGGGTEPGDAEALDARIVEPQVLRTRGRVIGVLIFVFDRADSQVPPASFLRDLASRAALAIDNSTLYEERRREVVTMQQHLLPTRLPVIPGLRIAASYTVGDQILEVGGDFYDVVTAGNGAAAAVIGDVCGRGVDAAALTGMARHTLAALLQEDAPPVRAMHRLNTRLRLDGSWRFVTAGVALLRPGPDGVAVDWTSAGHPAPVVMRRGGPAERGTGGGVPLGVLAEPRTGRSRVLLGPGDTLVIFTDGLTESRDADGCMFEEQALGETLERLRDAPVENLVDELSRASAAFGGTLPDDVAVLAIRAGEQPE